MYKDFSLRLTIGKIKDFDFSKLHSFLESQNEMVFFVGGMEHIGTTNEHIHVYIRVDLKMATFRARIMKHLHSEYSDEVKGNKYLSIKAIDRYTTLSDESSIEQLKTIAYYVKDGNIFEYNFPEDDLALAEDYDLHVKADMKANRKRTVIEQIMDLISEEDTVDENTIKECILDYHIKNNKLISRFRCVSYYDTILAQLFGKRYVMGNIPW